METLNHQRSNHMKRSNIDRWICETEHIRELTRENLRKLQLEKLNHLLRLEKERQGFYKDLPEFLNSLEDLKNLPFTTSSMLSERPGSFLLTSQSEVARVISSATSGTTGASKRVFYTNEDTEHTIRFFAAGISEMAAPGEKVLIAFPFSGPFGLGDLIEQAVFRVDAVPVRADMGQNHSGLARQLAESRADCYIGFAVPLLSALRIQLSPFLKKALLSGDACPKGVLRELEHILGNNTLFPHYGSRETGLGGAITCPAHEGMHLRENHIIGEIVDRNLHPVPDGRYGELVITTVGLTAMPLIRYRTGDYTRFLPVPCPCGSVVRRLDRTSRLETEALSMEQLDSFIYTVPELIDCRAFLRDKTLILEVLSLHGTCREELMSLLHGPGSPCAHFQIQIEEKTYRTDMAPLYPGKRFLAR